MGKEAKELPKLAELYEKLSAEQRSSLSKAVTEKLQTMIGGYGELGVLVEYISVMLQSSRPPEAIKTELEAFLQDQSGPFTNWLCEKLQKMVKEGNEGSKRRRREKREDGKEKTKDPTKDAEKKAKKEKKAQAAQAAAQAAATPTNVAAAPARSRSRKRRRRAATASTPVTVTTPVANQADRKAKLTPNVDYMHEGRPPKSDGREGPAPGGDTWDTRWSFRAPGGQPSHDPAASPYQGSGPSYPASRFQPPHAATQAPQYFTPKKWKVVRGNTVVRKSERLDSEEVQKLQEGEIVEQVAPAFTTENGIIRVQIRHPSSPLFPKPIGWVTQDATAAGGPKFLEPGPEPMQRAQPHSQPATTPGWRPPPSPHWGAWRPRPGVPPPRPAANYARPGFQNLTWTPS
ncbi:CPK2 [Symbiodinium natans]|uniref:CPK2 protein n=1 Tax=Symbiodinium natans TaxID=878477 RepID=A0A812R5C2_9DINO|nr:CPK2 [Symbiodinium natans]